MKLNEVERLNINNYTINSSFSRVNTRNTGILIMSSGGMEWSRVAISTVEIIKEEKQFEF